MITIRKYKISDKSMTDEVRKSAIKDLRKIYSIKKNANGNKIKKSKRVTRLVADINGKIVGTVKYRIEDDKIHIFGLAVHDKHRKKGVARAFIEELKKICANKNIEKISLYTIKETGNVEVFKKLGFKIISETIDKDSESDKYNILHDVYMEQKV